MRDLIWHIINANLKKLFIKWLILVNKSFNNIKMDWMKLWKRTYFRLINVSPHVIIQLHYLNIQKIIKDD